MKTSFKKNPQYIYITTDVLDYSHIHLADQSKRQCTLSTYFYNNDEKDTALNTIIKGIEDYKSQGWQEKTDLVMGSQYIIAKDLVESYYKKRFDIKFI